MDFQQANDYTNSYRSTRRATDGFRAAAATTYALGQLVKNADLLTQVAGDAATIIPTTAAALQRPVAVVSEDWRGFDGNNTFLSPGTSASQDLNVRGTQIVKGTVYGYHPALLVDQTNGSAFVLTHDACLASSQNAAGKAQGATIGATYPGSIIGRAMLPASGMGSSLAQGALAAATQTVTITGSPGVGDIINVTLQVPFSGGPSNIVNPGVVQTNVVTTVLNAATAASVTTAAAAVVANINTTLNNSGWPLVSTFYSAVNVAGVITITVVAAQFFMTTANSNFQFWYITTAGVVGNSLTITAAATQVGGSSVATAGGGTFAGGTGYVGTIPAYILLMGS